jgi:hypothetical protein
MIDISVIVEPRNHEYLFTVIDNIARNTNTPIQIFHSSLNENILKNYYKGPRFIFTKLTQNNLTILQYNILLTSLNFWHKINGENILIFQTDSCLVRHIDTFDFTPYLSYGFIGAPCKTRYPFYQNGGFSIRKKSLMIKAINNNNKYNNRLVTINEDKFFTVICKNIVNPSPHSLGVLFSVEQDYNENPLGLHKAWKYISKENWVTLKNKFPEISLTFKNL